MTTVDIFGSLIGSSRDTTVRYNIKTELRPEYVRPNAPLIYQKESQLYSEEINEFLLNPKFILFLCKQIQ